MRIADRVDKTPLRRSSSFSEELDAEVFFKLENRQTTGSFKLRGAMNCLLTLDAAQRDAGCVAASSGNHGAAVACAMQQLGVDGVVFVPEGTSSAKVEKIRSYGVAVEFFGTDGLDTEQHARAYARLRGMAYLSPYNDAAVIAGQGSCGVEIVEQCPEVSAVFVAVGGGGLIGGVGSVLKTHNPAVRIYGCQPAASDVMAQSMAAGEIVDVPGGPTLSDGTAGGIEAGAVTFPLNRAVVDEFVVVGENEIAAAMHDFMARENDVIEGAAGVAIAAMRRCAERIAGATVVTIICGGNIADNVLSDIRADGRTHA